MLKGNRDDAQITRLQQLGMNQFEEAKLLALRDYIIKLAHATARCVFIISSLTASDFVLQLRESRQA